MTPTCSNHPCAFAVYAGVCVYVWVFVSTTNRNSRVMHCEMLGWPTHYMKE
jgi:hypothetical protein